MIAFAVLGLMVAILLALAVTKLASVIKGSLALRSAPQGASPDFDSVLLKSAAAPGISVVCVAPDASDRRRAHVRRLLDLHYGAHEVVLVVRSVAGWTEDLRLVREERTAAPELPGVRIRGYYVSREPIRLLVLDAETTDPAKAWQAGIAAAQYQMIAVVDQEAEFIPECLLRLIRPMLREERMLAVCGLAPGPVRHELIGRFSALRTLCGWLEHNFHFAERGQLVLLPGATLVVRREAILGVTGFGEGSRELALELPAVRQVGFVPAAISWRRAAADWEELRGQLARDRYHAAPAFHALLETVALLAALGACIAGQAPWSMAGLVLLATAGAGILISMTAVVLRERVEPSGMAPGEIAALFFSAIPENLGYRQARNLWICLRSLRGHSA